MAPRMGPMSPRHSCLFPRGRFVSRKAGKTKKTKASSLLQIFCSKSTHNLIRTNTKIWAVLQFTEEGCLALVLDSPFRNEPKTPVVHHVQTLFCCFSCDKCTSYFLSLYLVTFSVMCYNVLCDKYCTHQIYGYCPSWALNWEYRKSVIFKELLHYGADILSLQVL